MSVSVEAKPKITMRARVFRIDWHRRPWFVPTAAWLWLGKRRVRFTGHWEDLGVIANGEDGTATLQQL